MLAHSFLYRIFKLPRVLNPIFYIGGLINSIYQKPSYLNFDKKSNEKVKGQYDVLRFPGNVKIKRVFTFYCINVAISK